MPATRNNTGTGAQGSIPRSLAKRCPRCGAAIGWKCFRQTSAGPVPLKNTHDERKAVKL